MPYQNIAKNSNEMSSNQCAYDGQCILRVISGRCFEKHPAEKYTERESSYPHYTAVLNLADIEFSMTLKDISKFERLNAMSMYTASKMDRFFFCGSPMTRKRSTSTYCTCKIHATTASATLRGSRICRVSWDHKLPGTITRNISATGKYTKNKYMKKIIIISHLINKI